MRSRSFVHCQTQSGRVLIKAVKTAKGYRFSLQGHFSTSEEAHLLMDGILDADRLIQEGEHD